MARLNLLDHAVRANSDEAYQIAKSLIKDKPLLGLLGTRAVTGQLWKTTEVVSRPTASTRAMNQGSTAVKSTSIPVQYKLADWQLRSEIDAKYLDTLEANEAAEERAIQAMERMESITDSFETLAFYGDQDTNQNDFNGAGKYTGSLNSTKLNDSPIVLGAGGSSSITSVYAFRIDGSQPVEILYERSAGALPTLTPYPDATLVNDADGNPFRAYVTDVDWMAGLRIPKASVGRIANIDDSSNKVTKALFSQLRRKMGGGLIVCVANPTVMSQLDGIADGDMQIFQNDTNLATEVQTVYGMPVFSSDSITQSETAVA